MLKLNLQQFAEETDAPIVVDIDLDTDTKKDEPHTEPPLVVEELPGVHIPEVKEPMPGSVASEAWKNVEELLVTLSNNTRVSMGQLRDDVQQLVEESRTGNRELIDGSRRINATMEEFSQLLKDATVEVPETQNQNPEGQGQNTPAPKKKSSFLGSRGRK